jgi:hypothetical protein
LDLLVEYQMKTLVEIQQQLASGQFEFSQPGFRRAVERNISAQEIQEAGTHAEIVKYYPDDKYSPSQLLLGFTTNGRPLHLQVSLDESSMIKIITIYQPDPNQWVNHRKRR